MVRVGGRSILHRQIDALHAAGADDLVIVRGYLGERISTTSTLRPRFVENPAWAENNILTSLIYARRDGRRLPLLLLRHRVRPGARPPHGAGAEGDTRSSSIVAGATRTTVA